MGADSGRGGAGNMTDNSPKITPKDLETPTLKTSVVTTGRGGSGNMAKNSDPYETRLRQDVEAVPRRNSGGATHYGRGGANVAKGSPEEEAAARKARAEGAGTDDDEQPSLRKSPSPEDKSNGLAAKGKQWLNNLTKKA
ncbi:hypothetical protein LZ32DRAFT_630536 [Colletotrichum eremochloae]|nr:hypothetical protein LZ32DRAFT_630536 [Colletotrichum eremochloae]